MKKSWILSALVLISPLYAAPETIPAKKLKNSEATELKSPVLQGESQVEGTTPTNTSVTPVKPNHYVSSQGHYSIQFPKDWEVMEGVMGTDVIALAPPSSSEDHFRENVNVIFNSLDFPIPRDDYYAQNLKSLKDLLTDFKLLDSKDISLGPWTARKIIFTHRMGVFQAKVLQYLLLEKGNVYVLTFTSDPSDFEKIKPIFESIAQTFKLEEKNTL